MPTTVPPRTASDRFIVLAAVCAAALVLPLDFSGAAIATPAIGGAFGSSPVPLAWVVNAFMLGFGSTLLTAGALADEYGRRRVFGLGLAGFVLVSVLICVAPSLVVLDLLRLVQGLAAAATLAGGSAALAQEFEGPARIRAFSLLGTTFGTGLAFGPSLAGLLIDVAGWRLVFLTGAVVGTMALVLGLPRLRETRNPTASGPDWPGAISFTALLACFTAGLLEVPASGWSNPFVIGLLGASAVLLVAFVAIERRAAAPMLDLGLFRYPGFVGVQALPMATTYSYVVLLVLLPSRFVGVEGHGEIEAGFVMLALSAPMLAIPLATAFVARRVSAGLLSAIGLVLAAAGLVWLARVPIGTPLPEVAGPMLLIGFGSAMPWGLMDGLAVGVVPVERAGMATGIFSTVRVAGEGIGLAITRAILASLTGSHLVAAAGGSGADVAALSHAASEVAAGDLSAAARGGSRSRRSSPPMGRVFMTCSSSWRRSSWWRRSWPWRSSDAPQRRRDSLSLLRPRHPGGRPGW